MHHDLKNELTSIEVCPELVIGLCRASLEFCLLAVEAILKLH